MNETDEMQQQRNTNLRFNGLCIKAREWLVEQLKAKGCSSRIDGHRVLTTAKDEATGLSAEARISIWLKMRGFSKVAQGISVKVERERYPIKYARDTEKWEDFPWDKIIAAHMEDLQARLRSKISYQTEDDERDRQHALAKEEVPLPLDPERHDGEHLSGFERRRLRDGTYHVHVDCHRLTAEQTRTIRDFVLAANQANHDPKNQTVAETNPPQEAPAENTNRVVPAPGN